MSNGPKELEFVEFVAQKTICNQVLKDDHFVSLIVVACKRLKEFPCVHFNVITNACVLKVGCALNNEEAVTSSD